MILTFPGELMKREKVIFENQNKFGCTLGELQRRKLIQVISQKCILYVYKDSIGVTKNELQSCKRHEIMVFHLIKNNLIVLPFIKYLNIVIEIEELSLCHKVKCSNPYFFAT